MYPTLSNLNKRSFAISEEGNGKKKSTVSMASQIHSWLLYQVNRFSCILQGKYIVPLQYFGTIFSPPLFSFLFCEMPSTVKSVLIMSKCSGNPNKGKILQHPKLILYIWQNYSHCLLTWFQVTSLPFIFFLRHFGPFAYGCSSFKSNIHIQTWVKDHKYEVPKW